MAESADALDSGSSRGNSVEVQVLLSAPKLHTYSDRMEYPKGVRFSFAKIHKFGLFCASLNRSRLFGGSDMIAEEPFGCYVNDTSAKKAGAGKLLRVFAEEMDKREALKHKKIGGKKAMLLSDHFICAGENFATLENAVPAPWFKTNIQLRENVETVSLTICGLGFYELYFNGKKITKTRLAPYISNPDDVIFYDDYDLTDSILYGDNEIRVLLGNGMQNAYGGYIWDLDKASFRSSPKLAFAVEILYQNGKKECIEADEKVLTASSNIIRDDLRLGECFAATIEQTQWKPSIKTASPKGEKRLSAARPIVVRDELKPIKIWQENDAFIYDFGVNTSGVCRLTVTAESHQKIVMTFGEILKDNRFYLDNITFKDVADKYFQQDVYICKAGKNIWEPSFTYHGFRYVKVEGITKEQATEDLLTFVVLHTDLQSKGAFTCDHEDLNTLHAMSLNATMSNFHHFPTDCPHREKNGWTADAALSSAHTLLYFEPTDNYKQWLVEICKAQKESGELPGIVPTGGWGFQWGNGPAWDSVITEIPYQIWQKRNDISAFIPCAPYILKYIQYLKRRRNLKGLLEIGLGDWCAPHDPIKAPLILTDSIEAYDIAKKASEMFAAIGDEQNRLFCKKFADAIKDKIRLHLFDAKTCTFAGNCQTSQAMGIYYGIVEDTEFQSAFDVLLHKIKEANDHIDTGVLGGRVIFHLLAEHGEIDTAIKMLTNKTAPSYMQWIEVCDTALSEAFIDHDGTSSHNHHFWGNISAFFMEQICGIRVMADTINIEPHFPKGISNAASTFESVYGKVSVKWKRADGKILFDLTYPEAANGKMILDGGKALDAKSGKYTIAV